MPLFWFCLTFLSGIILGASLPQPARMWWLGMGVSLLLAIARQFLYRIHWMRALNASRAPVSFFNRLPVLPGLPYSLLPALLFLGALRYQVAQPDLSDPGFIAAYNDTGRPTAVTGVIQALPDERDRYSDLLIEVESVQDPPDSPAIRVSGLLLARLAAGGDWRYGDRLVLSGELRTPPEDEEFSYRTYLARQGVYAYLPYAGARLLERGQGNLFLALIYKFKQHALSVVDRLWPEPEASLLSGILLGDESGIPAEVEQAFIRTGTSHIIAISGFNISIISGIFARIFIGLLGKRRRFLAAGSSLAVIAFYTVLVGAGASVVRAAIMGGLSLFAVQLGRRQDGLNSLAFVAGLMALWNPQILGDVGFQLSFMATLGLVLFAGPFSQAFLRLASRWITQDTAKRLVGPVGEYFLFTLAAQLTTLPVIIYHFRQLSLVSLLANPAILPAQPPIMTVGGLATLLGSLWLPLGKLPALLAWPFVAYTIRAVELFAHIPGGVIRLGGVARWFVLAYYALLFALTFGGARIRRRLTLVKPAPALALLGLATVLVWHEVALLPDGRLHLVVLNTGDNSRSGAAILIQDPGGHNLLLNGGTRASALGQALGRRLPFFNRRLDYLLVAASAEDQLAALPQTLERYPPEAALWAFSGDPSRSARLLSESLAQSSVPVSMAIPGQELRLGQDAVLRVLNVKESGADLLLEWKHFRALLLFGDALSESEALDLTRRVGGVTALVTVEEEYNSAEPPVWMDRINPQVVVPGKVDGAVGSAPGYNLLGADQYDWIELSTDGQGLWVEVKKK